MELLDVAWAMFVDGLGTTWQSRDSLIALVEKEWDVSPILAESWGMTPEDEAAARAMEALAGGPATARA